MFGSLGVTEILVIVGLLALLFGARRLPQLGRDLGQGLRNLYQGVTGNLGENLPDSRPSSSTDEQA
jgi:sec-independent protein translocase protein TatA